ncbi:MAG: hypothetical protein QM628_08845 [Propionicimonas sp.]
MATWRDGPEYAPVVRPDAFVEPVAEPLETPPTVPDLSAGAPSEQPVFAAPEQSAPDLTMLTPASVPSRDPHLAFEVVAAAVASPTAWGAAHTAPAGAPAAAPAWTPQQPFAGSTPVTGSIAAPVPTQPRVSANPPPFPEPGTPAWFSPPDASQRYQAPPQVSLGQVVRALTPAVLITLIIGALLNSLSLVMLGLSFALATRIPYRRQQIRTLYLSAAGLAGLAGTFVLVTEGFYLDWAWEVASGAAQVLCWLLPFALGLVVAMAMGKGEKPEARP